MFLKILTSPFVEKRWMHSFVNLSIVFWLYKNCWIESLSYQTSLDSILQEVIPWAWWLFEFLILVSTMLSSSWVSCLILISGRSFIIFVRIICDFSVVPSRLLKCSFHICIRFSSQAAIILALKVFSFYSLHLLSATLF